MRRWELEEIVAAVMTALGVVMMVVGVLTLVGCASAPEVSVVSAGCASAVDDSTRDNLGCAAFVELDVDGQRIRATVDVNATEDEAGERARCVLAGLALGPFTWSGLVPEPVSEPACAQWFPSFGSSPVLPTDNRAD